MRAVECPECHHRHIVTDDDFLYVEEMDHDE